MLSKNTIKYLNALQIKKYRQEYGMFLVEGTKSVSELMASDFEITLIVATTRFYENNTHDLNKLASKIELTDTQELSKIGTLQANDSCLAVAKTKENVFLYAEANEFVLVLDDIRDPGNLGTIIRVADWYGITKIVCSHSTTDYYNPKVIAASKGSFTRVKSYYTDLSNYFEELKSPVVYGTFLEGENIHNASFNGNSGYVVMGNESNGISTAVEKIITQRLTIPRFGEAESLNVGIATAIVLDNLQRRK